MIKKVRIKNFQKVKEMEMDFSSVTAIVGESERGKSCIFRGIEAAILNTRGNKFITKGASKCEVYIETDTGSVKWTKRGTGSATYEVVLDGKKEKFTKAEGLPSQAAKVLGVSEVDFGGVGMVVNLAGQFEPPFLLFESGTKVAKVLGKFTKLDEIYAAVRVANKDLYRIKQESGIRAKDLEAAEERLKRHEGLEKLEALLKSLEINAQKVEESESTVNELEEAVEELDNIRSDISAGDIAGVIRIVGKWPDGGLRQKVDECMRLQSGLAEVDSVLREIGVTGNSLRRAEESHRVEVDNMEQFKKDHEMCPACGRSWA